MKRQSILHIYCRVSTEIQVETGHSLLAQENAGIAKAKAMGFGYRLHIEKGKSGASDDIEFKNRPILKSLLDLCDEGSVTDIFVTEQDRLSRSPVATFYIKRILIENNIKLHTITQTIQLEDPEQSFVADLTSLLAKRERDLFIKRSKRGVLEGAKKGRWPGVILPYGYSRNSEKQIVVNEEEAKVYIQMVSWSLEGNGTNTIANKLNELGIETRCKKVLPNGTKVKNKYTGTIRKVHNEDFVWRAGTVYCILTNTIYKGERKFRGEILSAPSLIDRETWEKVQLNLKQNKNNSSNHLKHFYLLRGKLFCARCGSNYYGKIKRDERVYMCSSKRTVPCGSRSVNLDLLNSLIWGLVINDKFRLTDLRDELRAKSGPDNLEKLNKKVEAVTKNLLAIEKRRENLIILFEKSKISLKEFEERSEALLQEKNESVNIKKLTQREISQTNKSIQLVEKSIQDKEIIRTINLWGDDKKREFIEKKVKGINIHWRDDVWQHIIEVRIETAGFIVSEFCALVAKNKPSQIPKKVLEVNEMRQYVGLFPIFPHHVSPKTKNVSPES